MAEYPLLIFPAPKKADRTKQRNFGQSNIHRPNISRQGFRSDPKFEQLQKFFEARRAEIQHSIGGVEPEEVLVIEVIGSIEKFSNAVKNIEGFEFMGELETDEIEPDDDFYIIEDKDKKKSIPNGQLFDDKIYAQEDNEKKKLPGSLYLVMGNQKALNQMLSLWEIYKKSPSKRFETGLNKFRNVFKNLYDLRRWDVRDRLVATGVLDVWEQELKDGDNEVILFESELWFRNSEAIRKLGVQNVTNLVEREGGEVRGQTVIPDISYHGLLVALPPSAIRTIINNHDVKLVQCKDVMFIRPVGQMVVGEEIPKDKLTPLDIEEMPEPNGDPIVALFDGVPLENHQLLSGGRLIIDDPDAWGDNYQASQRKHGTAMASLIIHGDLNQPSAPLLRPIYVRPIMKPLNWPDHEAVPKDCLIVDLIHRAVRRMFEGEQGEGPVAPQVRIINFSIGDISRQFIRDMSPIARLLDWLSAKYDVLFIVSAGNHENAISLGVSPKEFRSFTIEKLESTTIKSLYSNAWNRKLLAPAETINGLSVGAAHIDDSRVDNPGDKLNPFESLLPSPLSAFGSGYRRAIKPDLIFNGGQQWYHQSSTSETSPATIEPAITHSIPPGNRTASPGNSGQLRATAYSCGTSNAAALMSRGASLCYEYLQKIFDEQVAGTDSSINEVPLLKTMLVHGCSWGEIGARISEVLKTPKNGHKIKGFVSRWLGYGVPTIDRVLGCTEQRVTVLGFGKLSDGKAHIFDLPFPSWKMDRRKFRLTVTLSWLSPISSKTVKYRTASLWYEVKPKNFVLNGDQFNRLNADGRAVKRGTVQHEVFEGNALFHGEDLFDSIDSHDRSSIEIKVNCQKDAGKIELPVAYGLAVSLEVAEGVAIYDEIRNRISRPVVQIQQTREQNEDYN